MKNINTYLSEKLHLKKGMIPTRGEIGTPKTNDEWKDVVEIYFMEWANYEMKKGKKDVDFDNIYGWIINNIKDNRFNPYSNLPFNFLCYLEEHHGLKRKRLYEKLHLNKNIKGEMSTREKVWNVHTGDTVLMIRRLEDNSRKGVVIELEICKVDNIFDDKIYVISKETGQLVNVEFEFENHQNQASRIPGTFAFGIDNKYDGITYWAALIRLDKALIMLNYTKRSPVRYRSMFNGYHVSEKQIKQLGKNWMDKFIDELNESNR